MMNSAADRRAIPLYLLLTWTASSFCLGRWSRYRKLAVFIIGTNVGQRDTRLCKELPRPVIWES